MKHAIKIGKATDLSETAQKEIGEKLVTEGYAKSGQPKQGDIVTELGEMVKTMKKWGSEKK